jgi:hypothetical protein
MAKKAKKEPKFVIRCTHCMVEDYRLSDVVPSEKVKHYTDTPAKYHKARQTPNPDFETPGLPQTTCEPQLEPVPEDPSPSLRIRRDQINVQNSDRRLTPMAIQQPVII